MPLYIPRRYRHFRRYQKIAEVLLRHGFGFALEQLDLVYTGRWRRRRWGAPPPPKGTRGERLRLAMEQLGPTFVKLGQLLSARPDVVPEDIAEELTKLQDHVPPVPFVRVRSVIEAELDVPLEKAFARFDVEPLAAASIGQVHRAMLHDGTEVAVKVQRPGIEQTIETDLDILGGIARLAAERFPTERFNPVAVVDEFRRVLTREMDFRLEATACQRFRDMFADDPRILVPEVFWDWTTERVFVMEYVSGVKVTDTEALRAAGTNPADMARLGAEIFLQQTLIEGFFHGDPHPGNLFVTADGRLAVLDFGVVGRLDDRLMAAVAELFIGVIQRDIERVLRGLARVGATGGVVDTGQLRRDIQDVIDRYHGRRLKEMELGPVVQELLQVVHRNRLTMPTDLLLLAKALVTVEGVGKALDPEFNAVEMAEPFAAKLLRRRLDPEALYERTVREGRAWFDLLSGLPPKLDTALTRFNHGDARVRLVFEGLERTSRRMERTGNRLVVAVVLAAVVMMTGHIFQAGIGPFFRGWPVLGLLGIASGAVTAVGLAVAVFRSGRL